MVHRGEVVVDCVVDRGVLCGAFWGPKNMLLFQIYFESFPLWKRGSGFYI
jgi:hypothetical protein